MEIVLFKDLILVEISLLCKKMLVRKLTEKMVYIKAIETPRIRGCFQVTDKMKVC